MVLEGGSRTAPTESRPFRGGFPAPEEETRGPMLSHRPPRMKAAPDTRDDVGESSPTDALREMALRYRPPRDFRRTRNEPRPRGPGLVYALED